MDQRILFRCDGGRVPEIGTGHVRRCLLLADYLQRQRGAIVNFLTRDYSHGVELVRAAGFHPETFPIDGDELAALEHTLNLFRPDVCVFDRLETTEPLLLLCRQYNAVVVCLDDLGAGLEHADIVINAILEQPSVYYQGPNYVVLPERPSIIWPRSSTEEGISLLLSFGGYDYSGLTKRVLDIVRDVPNIRRVVVVTADAEFLERHHSSAEGDRGCDIEVLCDVSNFTEIMSQADVAIISGGLTLFEAMRCGVPSLVVAQYEHQLQTARRYESLGATTCIGLPIDGFEDRLREALARLIAEPELREHISISGGRLVDGKGLQRVADLISICQLLEWDTTFFGVKVATLNVRRLTEPIVTHTLHTCEHWKVDCLYYLADCHHAQSVRLAEKYGFHFVDIRLTFEYALVRNGVPDRLGNNVVEVRPSVPDDVPYLREIARKSYIHSRYYFDTGFPRERCEAFYTEWIEKSCYGYADQVLVAEFDGRPVGYVTCQLRTPFTGGIELVGVDAARRGKAIGKSVVYAALNWFKQQGVEVVEVVTQGRNYAAQRLYQHCGFVTKQTQLWYHKWFDREI